MWTSSQSNSLNPRLLHRNALQGHVMRMQQKIRMCCFFVFFLLSFCVFGQRSVRSSSASSKALGSSSRSPRLRWPSGAKWALLLGNPSIPTLMKLHASESRQAAGRRPGADLCCRLHSAIIVPGVSFRERDTADFMLVMIRSEQSHFQKLLTSSRLKSLLL